MEMELIAQITNDELPADSAIMNDTIIVDTWNNTTTIEPAVLSARKEQLYESLIFMRIYMLFCTKLNNNRSN
ncbi:hypothetical protein B9Z55_009808 [Caenorhabditis nigoni]|uniref:Uncharacterized protein n=1 Tax=Caenorhabditis nigoni TaxID=1611254 RepID=A0A2G5UTL3_9PELO|nr:hypothetical protein B9Z55_009808 [Caenorhabditis nigoni]